MAGVTVLQSLGIETRVIPVRSPMLRRFASLPLSTLLEKLKVSDHISHQPGFRTTRRNILLGFATSASAGMAWRAFGSGPCLLYTSDAADE